MAGLGSRGGTILRITKSGYAVYAGGVLGASAGAAVAKKVALHSAKKELGQVRPGIRRVMGEAHEQVDARETIAAMPEFKHVHVIRSVAELMEHTQLDDYEKHFLLNTALQAEHGNNASAWTNPRTRQQYVFASKQVNKQILGHELGHIRDQKNRVDFGSRGFLGVAKGNEYASEKSGWERSPFKKGHEDEPIRRLALRTYQEHAKFNRTILGGLAAGAATGAYAGVKFMGRKR